MRRIRVLSIPSGHPYVAHLSDPDGDDGVTRLPDPPVPGAPRGQWWPPVALDEAWVRAHAGEFEVVHVHFGVEGRTLAQLDAWLAALREVGRPLVVTVHDLHNPHLPDNTHHRAQLDRLVPAADVVLTLTPGAARVVEDTWGVPVRVVPHPHVVPLPEIGADRPSRDGFVVGVHLKSLRADLDVRVLRALSDVVAEAAAEPPVGGGPVRLRVDVNAGAGAFDPAEGPGAAARARRWIREVADRLEVDVVEHPRFDDDAFHAYLAGLDLAVLPYAFGTHSGWLEACVDVGTDVLAPADGCYGDQHPIRLYDRSDLHASIARGLADSRAAGPRRLVTADSRRRERREVAAAHRRAYLDALAAGPPLATGTGR
ncbi:glycosyltransferase [Agilicoccus flavus]|uniref:glycosyltransferase n=1 Tax=Agilicoccus flavus TaxID=2775968 RepID=UPI001CF71479|nr:glycosyltransferase [Agilicoccus flavus]